MNSNLDAQLSRVRRTFPGSGQAPPADASPRRPAADVNKSSGRSKFPELFRNPQSARFARLAAAVGNKPHAKGLLGRKRRPAGNLLVTSQNLFQARPVNEEEIQPRIVDQKRVGHHGPAADVPTIAKRRVDKNAVPAGAHHKRNRLVRVVGSRAPRIDEPSVHPQPHLVQLGESLAQSVEALVLGERQRFIRSVEFPSDRSESERQAAKISLRVDVLHMLLHHDLPLLVIHRILPGLFLKLDAQRSGVNRNASGLSVTLKGTGAQSSLISSSPFTFLSSGSGHICTRMISGVHTVSLTSTLVPRFVAQ